MPARKRKPIRLGPLTNIRDERDGWSVIVRRKKTTFRDYFGDWEYGSHASALIAAQRFRDRLLLRLDADIREHRRRPTRPRNPTGIVGVYLERYRVEGRVYQRYVAGWENPQTGYQRRRFSVRRYGKEQARDLAARARQEGAARMHALLLAQQREAARRHLRTVPPMPRRVRDPRSRQGIKMPPRGRTRAA